MPSNFSPIAVSVIFLVINIAILYTILRLSQPADRKSDDPSPSPTPKPQENASQADKTLNASEILGWEFEYARTTASEAMQDRHTMVNFYLLAVGVVASGVVAVLSQDTNLPTLTGTILLWLLCEIGWLYFLKLIRLRQAWYGSAQAMNKIKTFYLGHSEAFDREVLKTAFLWRPDSLPPPHKAWNVFFYSATLIGLLDSVAYVAGGILLDLNATLALPAIEIWLLILLGVAFFAFHIWLYFEFLRPKSE